MTINHVNPLLVKLRAIVSQERQKRTFKRRRFRWRAFDEVFAFNDYGDTEGEEDEDDTSVFTITRAGRVLQGEMVRNTGRDRLEAFDRGIDYLAKHHSVKLGHIQVVLWNAIRIAGLKVIFGDSLLSNIDFLVGVFGKNFEFNDVVSIRLPRRSGKSVTEILAAVVFAVSQPEGNTVRPTH